MEVFLPLMDSLPLTQNTRVDGESLIAKPHPLSNSWTHSPYLPTLHKVLQVFKTQGVSESQHCNLIRD